MFWYISAHVYLVGTFGHILVHSQFLGRLINKICASLPCLPTQAACHLTKACFGIYQHVFDLLAHLGTFLLIHNEGRQQQILDLFDHQPHMGSRCRMHLELWKHVILVHLSHYSCYQNYLFALSIRINTHLKHRHRQNVSNNHLFTFELNFCSPFY